jgi:hypothetical protein
MKLFALTFSLLIPALSFAAVPDDNANWHETQRKFQLVNESAVLKNLVDTIEREHQVYCDPLAIEIIGDEKFKASSGCRNNEGWKLVIRARGTFVEEMPAMVDAIEMSYGYNE